MVGLRGMQIVIALIRIYVPTSVLQRLFKSRCLSRVFAYNLTKADLISVVHDRLERRPWNIVQLHSKGDG